MTSGQGRMNFEPEIVVLYCRQAVGDEASVAVEAEGVSGFRVRAVMVPCSSKVEIGYILRLLEGGADGVQLVACPEEGCRFLIGSLRSRKRVAYVRGLLAQVGIGAERVGISQKAGLSAKELVGLAGARAEAVKKLGANPMKKGERK